MSNPQEMKDVISVNNFKKILANFTARLYMEGGNSAEEITDETIKATHSLLISKLPEKKPEKPEGYPDQWYRGWDSAIDDVKAVLDELFGVQNDKV